MRKSKKGPKRENSALDVIKQDAKTNHTTNYPKDGHKAFCARCRVYNSGCPVTGTNTPSRSCSL